MCRPHAKERGHRWSCAKLHYIHPGSEIGGKQPLPPPACYYEIFAGMSDSFQNRRQSSFIIVLYALGGTKYLESDGLLCTLSTERESTLINYAQTCDGYKIVCGSGLKKWYFYWLPACGPYQRFFRRWGINKCKSVYGTCPFVKVKLIWGQMFSGHTRPLSP